jgi:hypothetical protein
MNRIGLLMLLTSLAPLLGCGCSTIPELCRPSFRVTFGWLMAAVLATGGFKFGESRFDR